MRLYFFPALLPLTSVLPELLAGVGFLAGVVQVLRGMKRGRKVLILSAVLASMGGMAVAWREISHHQMEQGSRLTSSEHLPRTEVFESADPAPTANSVQNLLNPTRFRERWSTLLPRKAFGTPIVSSGQVLLGTWAGTVDSFSGDSGSILWSLRKSEPVFAAVAPDESTQIVYSGDGLHTARGATLTAIQLPSGRALWQREFVGHLESAPRVDQRSGLLFVGAGPSGLWALGLARGDVRWHAPVGHVDATPLLHDGDVLVSSQPDERRAESFLSRLDGRNGNARWRVLLPGQPWGRPALLPGGAGIFLTTAVGRLEDPRSTDRGWAHAISWDGKLIWSKAFLSMPLFDSPVLEKPALVFLTLKPGSLLALRGADGEAAWKADLEAPVFTSPALAPFVPVPLLATVTVAGQVTIRNALDGAVIQNLEVGPGATASPVFDGRSLLVASPESLTKFESRDE